MADRPRSNPKASGPDDARARGDAAPDLASGAFEAPGGQEVGGGPTDRSLEERIEEALSTLSEVLEQADPFGELAAAAARATGDGAGEEESESFETVVPGAVFEPPGESEASKGGGEGDFEPVSAVAFEPVAADAEAVAGVVAEPGSDPAADAMLAPDPEESIETIEALLGEVAAALSEDEAAGSAAVAIADGGSTADFPGGATEGAGPAIEASDVDDSGLLQSALDEADCFEVVGSDALPEPSLEAELAHEASLAAAYEDGPASVARGHDAAGDIVGDFEAVEQAEGGRGMGEAAPRDESFEDGVEPIVKHPGSREPVAAPPAATAAPQPEPVAESIEQSAGLPSPGAAAAVDPAPAGKPKKGKPSAERETEIKAKKEPLLVRLRPRVRAGAYRICTAVSGPMTLVPVSMRDPVGAIAAFTLVNALLVWVLVLVLR